jgi:hypothetical protein
LVQCQLISIKKNWNPARSKVLPAEEGFYGAKVKLLKFTGIKGPIRKILKPVARA